MSRLPSLDSYDLQGLGDDEAALWGDAVADSYEDLRSDESAWLDVDGEAHTGSRFPREHVVSTDRSVS